MEQGQLFMALFLSTVLVASGGREMIRCNYGVAIVLIAIPVCYWLSLLFGKAG